MLQENSDISSDFDEESDIFSDKEYEIPNKKKSIKNAANRNKERSTKNTKKLSNFSQDKGKKKDKEQENEIDEKETKIEFSRTSRYENARNSLFIKKWANIEGVHKALFETIDEVIEGNEWQLKYSNESGLCDIDELILEDFFKTIPHLKLYIGAHEPSKLYNFKPFSSYSLNDTYSSKTGYIIYTGFPIWGLDWCPGYLKGKQYLAISGHPDYETHSMLLSTEELKNSSIQIWSFIPGSNDELSNKPFLEVFIFHSFGSVWDLKWCPLTSKIEKKLGFLACIFGDGCTRIFPVPFSDKPDKTLYIKLEQVKLSLKIYNTKCTCLCWISSNRIAIGTSNGQICIFDLEEENPNIPIISFFCHSTYIRNIASCSPSYPNLLISSAYDCTIKITDIRDPLGDMAFIQRQRAMNFVVQWWDKLSCIILNDNICGLRFTFFDTLQSSNHIISLDATLWAIAISPVHPFVAATGADGTVTIVNFIRKTFSKLRQPLSIRKIYQLSINYEDMSYLLVENFKPEKYQKIKSTPTIFPPEIGITVLKASWNPTEKYGGWLASGSTSGILRVEDLAF
ncbi:hypothetical protein PORY_001402 [Pneumocystis oryctolagi]|uniref:Uncharacterized protein n=1 Tax=Pneumocystis oryctolagi TaxID=42067 RepID=A0ACB7CFF2_9ASCO|nr:hypothetical protein PORY_001402 [Pneumocystis oryctolagi]